MKKPIYTSKHKTLCALLKEARKTQKIRQANLAVKMGWSQQILAQVEGGHRRIDVVEFLRITSLLDLDAKGVVSKLMLVEDE